MRTKALPLRLGTAVAVGTLTAGLTFAGGGHDADAATSYSAIECDAARTFQLRNNGTEIWYSGVSGVASSSPTAYSWSKVGTLPSTRSGLAIAAHDMGTQDVLLFVTDRNGGLRSMRYDTETRAIEGITSLASGTATAPGPYAFEQLTSNGRYLFGTKGGTTLKVMTGITAKAAPRGMATVSGWNNRAVAFFGNSMGSYQLGWTDTDGHLHYSKINSGTDGWTETSRTAVSSPMTSAAIASPGGGVVLRRSSTNLMRHLIDNPASSTSFALSSTVTTSYGAIEAPMTAVPVSCAVDSTPQTPSGDVTYSQLVGMFGSSRVGDKATVESGLPSLNAAMRAGNITTPARKAAFLATIVNESNVRYNAVEAGVTSTYKGRGFIQLTTRDNYAGAGSYLGANFVGNPSLAASLSYSAPAARWYWTTARPKTNSYADDHYMGGVNRAIAFGGYDNPSSPEVAERCTDFKNAYKYLTGAFPTNTVCAWG